MANEKETALSCPPVSKTGRLYWTQAVFFFWGNLILFSLVLKFSLYRNQGLNLWDLFWIDLSLAAGIWLLTALLIAKWKKGEKTTAFLAAMVNSSPDAFIGFSREGTITSWNKAAENLFGFTGEEMIGQTFLKYLGAIVPERLRKESRERFDHLWERGGRDAVRVETIRCHKDGRELPVSMTVTLIVDVDGAVIGQGGILRDVTEQKKAEKAYRHQEAQLRVSQKMDAIGRLAGGVAHDFNNLLVVMRCNSEFLLDKITKKDTGWNELTEIQEAAQRGSELTRQFLAFSNKQVSNPVALNLNDIAIRMNNMLHRLIYDHIEMYLFQEKDIKSIQADPTQIEQVILNLVINARDAMPNGGHLLLETQNVKVGPGESKGKVPEGNYVRLSVKDTGTGMSEEVQKHIFEPFFTTKGERGTGLGLATVYRIVREMGGHIIVQSELGVGTEFAIYFAASTATAAPAKAPLCLSLDTHGTEMVLVVEDDEPVRKILAKTLRGKGYRVLEASNGTEALQVAGAHAKPIDLLITDVMMPGMNGRDLAEKIVRERPHLKVLFISGYPHDVLSGNGGLPTGFLLLQKPFPAALLAQKIREILDAETVNPGKVG